jgi:hypothetical protein
MADSPDAQVPEGWTIIESEEYLDPSQASLEDGVIVPKFFVEPVAIGVENYKPPTPLSDMAEQATTVAKLQKVIRVIAYQIENQQDRLNKLLEG